MTKKWISDGRQRKTRKYLAKHEQLMREIAAICNEPAEETDKASRKRQASRDFMQRGERG